MIKLNGKYGCLTVLDMGEEYFDSYESRRANLISEIHKYENIMADGSLDEKRSILEEYSLLPTDSFSSANVDSRFRYFVEYFLQDKLKELAEKKSQVHYKCQCKCGRIHYYNEETVEYKPRFCLYPMYISTRHTYSVKAQNATYRKRQKYGDIECVVLRDKDACVPKPKYCDRYNKDREKKLANNAKKVEDRRAAYPRRYDEHYNDPDLTGKIHETLEVLGPVEDKVVSHEYRRGNKYYGYYEIFKQYRCRCPLCGKEYLFCAGDFSVNPPTAYGDRAYNGWWSVAHCACHFISSFQWTVCWFLEENRFRYYAEAGFPGLLGVNGGPLRFDFIILDTANMVRCIIECQGEQHYVAVDEFGGESKLEVQQANDALKRKFAVKYGIPFIELSYDCGRKVSDRLKVLSDKLQQVFGDGGEAVVKLG